MAERMDHAKAAGDPFAGREPTMSRSRPTAGSFFLVTLMTLATAGPSSGQGSTDHRWDDGERAELLRYARDTWHSFEAMVRADGLPSDQICRNDKGEWHPSIQTSPTDIASYLWSTLAARSLGLIDEAEADRRLGATLTTLGRLDRDHGFFFNLYNTETRAAMGVWGDEAHPHRPFLSTVDNGWLAAALIMVRNARPALRGQAEALLGPMDFGFFYVPFDPADHVKRPGQLRGGYYADDRTFTPFCYGMLITEPRIASYVGISRGQIPAEHYYRLYRTLPADRRQFRAPVGETRHYLGVPVFEGHYTFRDFRVVPSWGGSMFEALMVPLLVPEERWAPKSWGVNHPLYVRGQIEEGLEVRRYGYWGFSPCSTPEAGYQAYGVNGLGTEIDGYYTYETPLKKGTKGDGVVTPHASFLALRFAPREALANLRKLEKAYPIYGPHGFADSVNVHTGVVSHCVISLDQGMILAAIANALADDAIRHAFSDGMIESAIRPLMAPEEFTAGPPAPGDLDVQGPR